MTGCVSMYVSFDVLYSSEKRVEILSFPCLCVVQIQSSMKGEDGGEKRQGEKQKEDKGEG